ncbi:hypothetical protein ACS0PU_010099 [Formica fusca]
MVPETGPRVQLTKRIYTRCDAGTPRAGRNSKPRNGATRPMPVPVRLSSLMGQRTPLSRHRGCHLLRHWRNHSEKPIESTIHFFLSARAGQEDKHFFLRSASFRRNLSQSIPL